MVDFPVEAILQRPGLIAAVLDIVGSIFPTGINGNCVLMLMMMMMMLMFSTTFWRRLLTVAICSRVPIGTIYTFIGVGMASGVLSEMCDDVYWISRWFEMLEITDDN